MPQHEKPLMFDAYQAEARLYAARYDVTPLLAALRGIASCATACKCCQMHADIAAEAVERWERAHPGGG